MEHITDQLERAVNLELELAHKWGWTDLQMGGMSGEYRIPDTWLTGKHPKMGDERRILPQWARNAHDAFNCAVAFNCWPKLGKHGGCWFIELPNLRIIFQTITPECDQHTAAMLCIVEAAVQSFEPGPTPL